MVGVPLLDDYSLVGDTIFDLNTSHVRNAISPETIFEAHQFPSVITQNMSSQERPPEPYGQRQQQPQMQPESYQSYQHHQQQPIVEALLPYQSTGGSNMYSFPYDDILHYLLSRDDIEQHDFVNSSSVSGPRMETPNLKDRSVSSSISMSRHATSNKWVGNEAWQAVNPARQTNLKSVYGNRRVSQQRWKVNPTRAKIVSDSVNASIDREFDVLLQYKLNYNNRVQKPPVSRRRRNPNCIEWKLVSIFKMYTNLVPKEIENTDYYDQIPQCSCFGTINMRIKGAWRRFSGSSWSSAIEGTTEKTFLDFGFPEVE